MSFEPEGVTAPGPNRWAQPAPGSPTAHGAVQRETPPESAWHASPGAQSEGAWQRSPRNPEHWTWVVGEQPVHAGGVWWVVHWRHEAWRTAKPDAHSTSVSPSHV